MSEGPAFVRLIAVNPDRFSLGLAYLDTVLRDRFGDRVRVEQTIFDLTAVRQGTIDLAGIIAECVDGVPSVVGLSWYCWNHRLVQDLAVAIGALLPDGHIVVGGPEAGTIDEAELRKFPQGTVFVLGEGESALCAVLDQILENGTSAELPAGGARLTATGIERSPNREAAIPVQQIPSPVLAGALRDSSTDWLPSYATTRGCVFKCSFCAWQDGFREREFDLDVVRRELDVLASRPYDRIWITDTIFGRNEPRALEILDRLRSWPHPTRFAFELHAKYLSDRLAQELAKLPLAWAAVGIQSLAPNVLKLTRRSPYTDQLLESVGRLYSVLPDRSSIHLDIIFGLPNQTVRDCFETVDVLLDAFPDATIFTGTLQIVAGTAFEKLRGQPGWVVLPPEGDCEVVATPDIGLEDMRRVRDLSVGLDAYTVARGTGGPDRTTAAELAELGESLRGTEFAAHPVYGRRESFTAEALRSLSGLVHA